MADPYADSEGALVQANNALGLDTGPEPDFSEQSEAGGIPAYGPGTSAPKVSQSLLGRGSQFSQMSLDAANRIDSYRKAYGAAGQDMISKMDSTTQKLQGMNFGPSPAEKALVIGAAMGQNTKTGRFGETLGNVTSAMANLAKESRQAEMQKQMLIAQYGIQGSAARMKNASSMISQDQATMRAANGASGSATTAGARMLGKGIQAFTDPTTNETTVKLAPGADNAAGLMAYASAAGHPGRLVTDHDGSQYVVSQYTGMTRPVNPWTGGPFQESSSGSPSVAPTAASHPARPMATSGAAPGAAAGITSGAAPMMAPASTSPQAQSPASQYRSWYTPPDQPNVPGNVFNSPKYEAAFERASQDAFAPQNLFHSIAAASGTGQFGQTAAGKGQSKAEEKYRINFDDPDKPESQRYQSAQASLQAVNEMMRELDGGATTGAWANNITDIRNKLVQVGLLSKDSDDYNKLVNNSELIKYATKLTTSGLKSDFGGRVTNMDVQMGLKSNANPDMPEPAIRAILKTKAMYDMQAMQHHDFVKQYMSIPGADPTRADDAYRKYMDPFSASRFKQYAGGADFGSVVTPNKSGYLGLSHTNGQGWVLTKGPTGTAYVNPKNPTEFSEIQVH